MVYGYARVSTATQGQDGNSLEDQIVALELLSSGMSYKQVESMTGISKSTLVRAAKQTKEQGNSDCGKKKSTEHRRKTDSQLHYLVVL